MRRKSGVTARSRAAGRVAIGVGLVFLAGCGGGGGGEIESGCRTGDDVPAPVRAELEAAADSAFARMNRGAWDALYADAAPELVRQGKKEEFLGSLQATQARIGLPRERTTSSISVVRFDADFPPSSPVDCDVAGSEDPRRLILGSHPVQASLVQEATVGAEQFYYSTLWHREDGEWKLAAFYAKPATFQGKRWPAFAEEAAAERLAERVRNSALLYKIAIDLAVPNAWTQPEELKELQRKQSRLRISAIPLGQAETWGTGDDAFRVFYLTYGPGRDHPGLVLRYYTEAALEDTLAQQVAAERLLSYVVREFPEYDKVFDLLTVVAVDSISGKAWLGALPLGSAP